MTRIHKVKKHSLSKRLNRVNLNMRELNPKKPTKVLTSEHTGLEPHNYLYRKNKELFQKQNARMQILSRLTR